MNNLEVSILKARLICNTRQLVGDHVSNKTLVKMVLGVRETLASRRCYEMGIDQLDTKLNFNEIEKKLKRSYRLAKESKRQGKNKVTT